ncbi:MAG: DUF4893 domain-containing protein, partial [Paracoccus sp. (in: a-proteobacteria)]
LAVLAVLAAAPAAADPVDLTDQIRPDDRVRMDQLDATAGRALTGALATGDHADIAVLVAGLRGTPLPASEAAPMLAGDWSCRMLKLGGGLPLTVYQPFRCRIGPDGRFDKLTGSQQMAGRIGVLDGHLTYLGTAFVAGETPAAYADLPIPIDTSASPQLMPEAGRVEVVDGQTARL